MGMLSEAATDAKRAYARVGERGEARTYGDAHLAARWHLRFFEEAPVGCAHCPATEATTRVHAALDWEHVPVSRLRTDSYGKTFSIAPDLDYIPLCMSCHRSYDMGGWRKFAMQRGTIN